ncbi:MAG TPA: LysR family transcriptional regulator [Acidocella sp.]|jgi:DNA-binding transcriptional LysR family regulator|uniref:LysR family transcriptional regulator n=1 Tax=Acidocella sp. TaxID=50710 RepID=UPI002C9E0011|nr:LysR family transcriptional regulator [Acidocella sp.]HVE20552.1 LysR family transcriptional regulator [Acidocella sp.]
MRRVTLKQLRIAAAAGRLGSFTAAGDAVGLTPSAVSMQMKALAEEVGLPLFEFAEGRLLLTKAGEEVLAAAARIEAVLSDCDQAVAGLRDPRRGRVVVGVVSTAKYFAPQALGAFHKAYPLVELKLVIGNRTDIISGLRQREIDIAIMGRPPEGMEVELVKLADHPHVIIAAPDHPLRQRRRLEPADLGEEIFLVRERGSGTRMLMEQIFAKAGVTPRLGMEISSNETIKQAVMAGLGIAFISGHTVGPELADGRLVTLDVVGLPVVRQWYAVHLTDRTLLPAAQALQALLREHMAGLFPPGRS